LAGVEASRWIPLLVVLPLLGFWAYCLYDFARTPAWRVRGFDRSVWILLLVFTGVFGGALWLVRGRPQGPMR
jgi:hypothetical protein